MSPGTRVAASTVLQAPSRSTVACGARPFFSAASAFVALHVLPEVEDGVEDEQGER